jgi:hypothetical protein
MERFASFFGRELAKRASILFRRAGPRTSAAASRPCFIVRDRRLERAAPRMMHSRRKRDHP